MRRTGTMLLVASAIAGSACTQSAESQPLTTQTTLPELTPTTTPTPESTIPTTTAVPVTSLAPNVGPDCFYIVQPGDELKMIESRINDPSNPQHIQLPEEYVHTIPVNYLDLAFENGIEPDRIFVGQPLDICIGNASEPQPVEASVDTTVLPTTTTSTSTIPANLLEAQDDEPVQEDPAALASTETTIAEPELTGVAAIQAHTNQLLGEYDFPELAVDGDYGPLTQQATCQGLSATGHESTRARIGISPDLDEQAYLATKAVTIPPAAQGIEGSWALVDRTCQTMMLGTGDEIDRIMPVSTGSTDYQTRLGTKDAFLYRPAEHNIENPGWHNSSAYPVEADNPLNGNMYRPIYFDNGQAIHGAGNVPPHPASKGCVRTSEDDQNFIVEWLQLAEATPDQNGEVWNDIGLTVIVTGEYEVPAVTPTTITSIVSSD